MDHVGSAQTTDLMLCWVSHAVAVNADASLAAWATE